MLDVVLRLAPVIPALATALVPILGLLHDRSPDRRLRENLAALAALQDRLPPEQRNVVGREMREHLEDLSAEIHYRRVRRIDAATIALMVILDALAMGCVLAAYFIDHWIAWTIFGVLALMLFGFSLVGLGELYELPPGEHRLPTRLKKEKNQKKT